LQVIKYYFILGIAPYKVIVAFIKASRFSGNDLENSYKYDDHGLKAVKLSIDSQSELKDYINIDMSKGDYSQGLLSLLETQSLYRRGRTLAITPELYQNGHTLFGFDLTPAMTGSTGDNFQTLQRGNLRLHVEFKMETTNNIICYFMMFFDSEILITNDRQIMFDYNT
jgi:hypothetical protein